MTINNAIVQGNLVADPTAMGEKGARVRLGFSTVYVSRDDEKVETSHYLTVKVWGPQAGPVLQYLHKGDPCIVHGRLELDQWETEGEKRQEIVLVAIQVQFLPKGEPQETPNEQEQIPL